MKNLCDWRLYKELLAFSTQPSAFRISPQRTQRSQRNEEELLWKISLIRSSLTLIIYAHPNLFPDKSFLIQKPSFPTLPLLPCPTFATFAPFAVKSQR